MISEVTCFWTAIQGHCGSVSLKTWLHRSVTWGMPNWSSEDNNGSFSEAGLSGDEILMAGSWAVIGSPKRSLFISTRLWSAVTSVEAMTRLRCTTWSGHFKRVLREISTGSSQFSRIFEVSRISSFPSFHFFKLDCFDFTILPRNFKFCSALDKYDLVWRTKIKTPKLEAPGSFYENILEW